MKEGKGQPPIWKKLKNQIYLGSDTFVEDMQCKLLPDQPLAGVPKIQKQSPPKPLTYFQDRYASRNEALAHAYLSGHYTLAQVGAHFGVSYATVSRAVKALESEI
ncbi:Uncharacterised protein [BD1-7 clade bacterium]|nr:Uncharacterised protein [BD1-7 clade bacterium]